MRVKLSKAHLENAKPAASRYLLRDSRTVGLALKVEPSGTRTFVFEYRVKGRPSQRFNIGRYGEPWTLDQARAEAGRLRALVDRGLDPLAQRRVALCDGRSVGDLAERVLLHTEKLSRRPRTLYIYRRMLQQFILPRLGRMRVEDVTVEHVERLHTQLRATPYQANQVLQVLCRAFTLAERWGWVAPGTSPVRQVEKYREYRRGEKKAVMLDPAQIARLLGALEDQERKGADPHAVAALRIAFWTGWRTHSEILPLQWSNIDLETGRTRLLATKEADEEYRMLPDEALAVLRCLPRLEGCPWVFPGINPARHRKEVRWLWNQVRRQAGLLGLEELGNFRLHDLRHNAVSWDVSRGVSLKVAGASVGHRSQRSTEVYSHFMPAHLQAAVNARAQAMREAAMMGQAPGSWLLRPTPDDAELRAAQCS